MDQLKLHEGKRRYLTGLLTLAILIGVCLGAVLAASWYFTQPPLVLGEYEVHTRSTTIVGVTKEGTPTGELATLTVEIRWGDGRTLLSVPPYENDDTQRSAINAKLAAERETYDLSYVDVIISIESEAEAVTGPSAGAAMAVALVAAIHAAENEVPNEVSSNAVISATVNEYGRLGPVGDIGVKINAAKDEGFTVFVVATNQTNVPDVSGIEVKKAQNLSDAIDLMLV
jgi:predicted S18 family serine protease